MSYRSAALSGMAWSLTSQGVRMILQLASTVILARLLSPEDFGIFAMILPVAALAGLLQDFGLNQAIIHKENLTADQINAMFWINLAITAFLAVCLIVFSPLVAAFYGESRVAPLVSAWSIMLIMGGLSFGQYAQLARAFRFRALALIDVACALVAFSTSVGISYLWPSYWALWFGGFASLFTWTVLTFSTRIWRPGWWTRGVKLDGMFTFGMNLMFVSLADFASRNVDNILIGRNFGGHVLGLYDRAYKLLLYPLENLGAPLSRVMIPVLSRMQNDPDAFRRAFLQMSGVLGLVYIPGMAVAIGCSHDVVRIFLGEKWLSIVPIFYWLGFVGLLQPFISSCSWLLISQGRSKELMYVSVSSSLVIVTAFFIGIYWGAIGVAIAYAAAEAFYRMPLLCYRIGRQGSVRTSDIVATLGPLLVVAALAMFSISALTKLGVTGWLLIFLSLAAAYAEAVLVLSLTPRGRSLLATCLKLAGDAWAKFRPGRLDRGSAQ